MAFGSTILASKLRFFSFFSFLFFLRDDDDADDDFDGFHPNCSLIPRVILT